MSFRAEDAGAFALSLHRGWTRLAPDIELVAAPIRLDAPAPVVPAGATVFVLVGPRWLRSKPGDPSFLAKASDPMRRLLEASLKGGHRIVPVLFEVSLSDWGEMCREFPPTLENLAPRNAVELQSQSFSQDLQLLINRLRSPAPDVPWTEAESQSVMPSKRRVAERSSGRPIGSSRLGSSSMDPKSALWAHGTGNWTGPSRRVGTR